MTLDFRLETSSERKKNGVIWWQQVFCVCFFWKGVMWPHFPVTHFQGVPPPMGCGGKEKQNKTENEKQKNKNKNKQTNKKTKNKEKPNLIKMLGWRIKKNNLSNFFLSLYFFSYFYTNEQISNSKAKAFITVSLLASDNFILQDGTKYIPRKYSLVKHNMYIFKVCVALVLTQVLWVRYSLPS